MSGFLSRTILINFNKASRKYCGTTGSAALGIIEMSLGTRACTGDILKVRNRFTTFAFS
jgi:hypothetical protein